ncbi:MAG TPA: ABC transporter permease subunit [Candidatus Limnocylindria bacterium]|nr:ABC transporter permease subunit [Candidatus Limnocylindria bacterium]
MVSPRVSQRHPRPPWVGLSWATGAGPTTIALLVGIGFWEAVGQLAGFRFFPPFSAVVARLFEMIGNGEILPPLMGSLQNLAIGFSISVVVGIVVGLLMGAYKRVEVALDVYVYALLTAPSLVFAPIMFSIFGLGPEPIIGVIIIYTVFIIIINTASAVQTVPRTLIEMGRSYCANDRQIFWRIILPSALPMIMAGLRLAGARAVEGMVNGELFIAAVGLGAVISRAGARFDATTVLAVLVLTLFIAFIVVRVIMFIDRRATSWLPETQRGLR